MAIHNAPVMDGFGSERRIESGLARVEFGADINHVLILEQDLTPEMRHEIGEVLLSGWFPANHAEAQVIRERGWFQAEPYARVLAKDGERIIGQGSLVDLTTDGSPMTVHGLADLAVIPEARGRGIGTELVRRRVDEALRRQAGAIITATVVPPVIRTLQETGLGFEPAGPSKFFFWLDDHPGMRGVSPEDVRDEWRVFPDRSVANDDWWAWVHPDLKPQLEGRRVRIKYDF